LAGILASLFYAIELNLTKILLEYYSPFSMYFVRCTLILLFVGIIFRPNLVKELNKKDKLIAFSIGILWVIAKVLSYYGYASLGLVYTTLILMVAPILIYFLAWKFLKEKLEWRNIIGAVVILACVLFATLT
jgi:drug/metabolite transporter (DMT)-like permease